MSSLAPGVGTSMVDASCSPKSLQGATIFPSFAETYSVWQNTFNIQQQGDRLAAGSWPARLS